MFIPKVVILEDSSWIESNPYTIYILYDGETYRIGGSCVLRLLVKISKEVMQHWSLEPNANSRVTSFENCIFCCHSVFVEVCVFCFCFFRLQFVFHLESLFARTTIDRVTMVCTGITTWVYISGLITFARLTQLAGNSYMQWKPRSRHLQLFVIA